MLTGTWHLVRWDIVQDGRVNQPFGPGATGMIQYTTDGHMSACIAAAGRQPYATGNPRTANGAEKIAAHDSYFHYAGSYEILPGPRVVHRVTQSLNPGFPGTEQVRDIHLDGDTLTLSADEGLPGGATRHHRIVWRR
jgi:hypothetical protein